MARTAIGPEHVGSERAAPLVRLITDFRHTADHQPTGDHLVDLITAHDDEF